MARNLFAILDDLTTNLAELRPRQSLVPSPLRRGLVKKPDARVKTFIIDVLKKNKALSEREVKAAVRRGLKLGNAPLSAGVIREVRRKLGIDRPRAISYAKNLLAKNPTLEAKKVIEDVGERFGISLQAPDVSRLRPAAAQRKRKSVATVHAQAAHATRRSHGTLSVTYEASGTPEDVAQFFRSLAE